MNAPFSCSNVLHPFENSVALYFFLLRVLINKPELTLTNKNS